jgi:hypothetical protein
MLKIGSIGADAECQCQDGHSSEAGRLAQRAKAETHVLPQRVQKKFPAGRADDFLGDSRLPCSKRTARNASSGFMPSFIFSSAAISRKPFSSSSNSFSTRSLRNSDRNPSDRLRSSDMSLLVTKCDQWVDTRSAACREVACGQRHRGEDRDDGGKR